MFNALTCLCLCAVHTERGPINHWSSCMATGLIFQAFNACRINLFDELLLHAGRQEADVAGGAAELRVLAAGGGRTVRHRPHSLLGLAAQVSRSRCMLSIKQTERVPGSE